MAAPGAPPHVAGVIGHPIGHSRSPALHRAGYAHLGLEIGYSAHDVTPERLPGFVDALRRDRAAGRDWLGCSVTMPLKGPLMEHADHYSERAARLGFLNTLVWDEDGAGTAYNTDVDGIVEALIFAGYDRSRRGGTLGVLGGGGTAAAAIAAAELLGMDGVDLLVRTPAKAADHLGLARRLGLGAHARPLRELTTAAPGYRAVVATLPPGAADEQAAVLGGPGRGGGGSPGPSLPPLLDAAYDPWPSELATAWQQRGGSVVSGLEMLLYQAVEQVRLFTARLRRERPEPDWPAVTDTMAGSVGLPPR